MDKNGPNFAQLTSINEWLTSLNLSQYAVSFLTRKYRNLSQVLHLEASHLRSMGVEDEQHQCLLADSLRSIQFELNFHNGFLV